MSTEAAQQRTPEEIENLKDSWASDPCWDIEDTEGFEAHYEELKAFHEQKRAYWDAKWDQELRKRRANQRQRWGESLPDAACDYLHALEERLSKIENTISRVKNSALYDE
ncbi:hypothetical protein LJ737_20940 [Hymenobacter sp. 15J16-1T3B]|uniref:hypothetical protein n=1 Tax=Hymenobacter sp. 15J16-1T3B TaxID=2886941 RepID=UPI001D1090A9|nr:hypothetical protein [Hymenobacter sp. 15J16-1T3B]MCC3159721.1 hypothetical protein [Hymenobacter sp. 15J16-1T3B]